MKWSTKQILFLKKHYANTSKGILTDKLCRSWDAITKKASLLELKRDNGSSLIDIGLDTVEEHMY